MIGFVVSRGIESIVLFVIVVGLQTVDCQANRCRATRSKAVGNRPWAVALEGWTDGRAEAKITGKRRMLPRGLATVGSALKRASHPLEHRFDK